MYPGTSSQNGSPPAERRRSPRHRASSLIYVQIGSENGGIAIDLGIDGVACQAARKLAVEGNTNLKLRLHGSGLDVDLVGDLVWLGASRKEVGLSFKSPSGSVQQVIADWIERETKVYGSAALDDRPPLKPIPAIPGIRATNEKSVSQSLSAALAMSRAFTVFPPSSVGVGAKEARLTEPTDPANGRPGTSLLPEIATPIKQLNDPLGEWQDRRHGPNADSLVSSEPYRVEQPLYHQPPLEVSPIEDPPQSPGYDSFPMVLCVEPLPRTHQALPQPPEEPTATSEFFKSEGIEPVPQERVSRSPDSLLQPTLAERWIPPALLDAWRQSTRQQKFLFANVAAACVLAFALILTMAVAHTGSTSDGGALQQSTAAPVASSVSADSPQTVPLPATPAPRATARPRPHQPPTSLLSSLGKFAFGNKPEVQTEIDEDQVGVQVWTSKASGYYYCSDSQFYNAVQPGALMTQRDALQSGYQPRLGQFCN